MARKKTRKDDLKPALLMPAKAPASPGRSTFSVSKALDKIRDTLPDTVYQGRKPRLSTLSDASVPRSPAHQSARAKAPLVPDRHRDQPLDMKPLRECKKRPDTNRGNGGSRPFVPWCDRRS